MAIVGHWRDNLGGQIPGTGYGGFDVSTQIRNDGNVYNLVAGNSISVPSAGSYYFEAQIRYLDTSNGRYNPKGRFLLTSGSGTLFTTHKSGYSRDNSENVAWLKIYGFYTGGGANDTIQLQHIRDTDAPAGGSVAGQSDFQVVELPNIQAVGIYGTTASNSYGGTARNRVTLNQTILESDTSLIERSGDQIQLKNTTGKYIVLHGISGSSGSSRTQRISNIDIGGTPILDSQSYAYQRNGSNEYGGTAKKNLHVNTGAATLLGMQCFRGLGVSADQGGANVDGNWSNIAAETGLCIIELPAPAKVARYVDSVGIQNITPTASQSLNVFRDVVTESDGFSSASNTEGSFNLDTDLLIGGTIFAARNNVASGARYTGETFINIDGTNQTTGQHGNYSRGNQGSQDTFGWSAAPGGIYAYTANDPISISVNRLAGGEAGGTDRTQPNTAGIWMLDLDSLNIIQSDASISYDYNVSTQGATKASATGAIAYSYNVDAESASRASSEGSINYNYAVTASVNARIQSQASISYNYAVQADTAARISSTAGIGYDYNVEAEGIGISGLSASIDYGFTVSASGQTRASSSSEIGYAFSTQAEQSSRISATAQIGYDYDVQSQVNARVSAEAGIQYDYDVQAEGIISGALGAQISYGFNVTAQGALRVAGSSSIQYNYTTQAQGALRISSSAQIDYQYTTTSEGELKTRSSGVINYSYDVEAQPNARNPRSSSIQYDFGVQASPNARIPSSAQIDYEYQQNAQGGTRISGQSSINYNYLVDAEASTRVQANASINYIFTVSATGAIESGTVSFAYIIE